MQPLPCFLYEEGVHFHLPDCLCAATRVLGMFTRIDEDGRAQPVPEVFSRVANAEEAAVFLFPWDIGQYIDGGRLEAVSDVIGGLPYLAGRERRHIVCDAGDFFPTIPQPVCLFATSVPKTGGEDRIPMAYTLPDHVLHDGPVFDWCGIRFDTSFVGNATNAARRAAVASVRLQAPNLRLFADFDDSFLAGKTHFVSVAKSAEHRAARQALYRKSLKESLTVLCPPGIGPQSIRLYETMYMGRIPVIFDGRGVLPLRDMVDYGAFCLVIPEEDVMNTGAVLRHWLAAQTPQALRERCVLACKTWNAYFSPARHAAALLAAAARKFWD